VLQERIERVKRYPALARQWGMEGTAELEFRIARNGSVQDVVVVKSSGFPLLDEASVETIKRAQPLPAIPGTIRIPISYRLRGGP
jgi:protein TonB